MHSGVLFATLTFKVFGDVIIQVFQERSKRLLRNRLIEVKPQNYQKLLIDWKARHSGLMVGVFDSGVGGWGTVVFLGKTLDSHSVSPNSGV